MKVLNICLFAELNYVYFFTKLLQCYYFSLPLNFPMCFEEVLETCNFKTLHTGNGCSSF